MIKEHVLLIMIISESLQMKFENKIAINGEPLKLY